jgi:spore maturation protein CgeB
MIQKINYIFNNKKKIDRIRENGYKFALEKHNYKNRIQYLLNKLSIKN